MEVRFPPHAAKWKWNLVGYVMTEACSPEEKQLALKKALESHTFARSEQLKAFLRYICEAKTQRPGAPLTEYVIGVEVLGRPEGYSPAEDSSVRTRAYELRQKLERLYMRELPDEDVQICVPKGTYAPHFIHRAAAPLIETSTISLTHTAAQAIVPAEIERARGGPAWIVMTAVLATAILASLFTWVAARRSNTKLEPDAVLAEAWGPLAEREGSVVLCLATPLALVVGPRGHAVFGSKEYPVPDDTFSVLGNHRPLSQDARLSLTFTDDLIAVGTLNAAVTAVKTLRSFGTAYQLLPERVATASALRGRNSILFGASVDSEAVYLALSDMPLTIEFEPSIHEFVVRDTTTGKFIAPKKDPHGDFKEVFGLLTVKVIRDSDRRAIESVIFSGITSVGVQGAAEFFSSPATMANLRSLLAKEHAGGFPASYQVVIRCTYTNLQLLSFDYYSHRVVKLVS